MTANNPPYFTKDFLDFFKELAANNDKDWFDDNRQRYAISVKEPFKNFIGDLIENIRSEDPRVQISAKDAIFRINRDIRFSPNKAPYKLDRSAIISPAGRKDHSVPGYYISLGPEFIHMGGGAYFLKTDQLYKLRHYIADHLKIFKDLLADANFERHFGALKGEEHKRLPKELKEVGDKQPLIYKKQLYYMTQKDASLLTSPNLMEICLKHYHAGLPLQDFLSRALA